MPESLLEVRSIHGGYGATDVLFGVDLEIEEGQVVSLFGRNGMGKTSTIRAIMGILPLREGEIRFAGQKVSGRAIYNIARLGIGLVPEGRQLFPSLTVRENLVALARPSQGAQWTLDKVLDLFPLLAGLLERGAGRLSGGEQQMVAIGRALMTNPRLLILDEATEGLAPVVRQQIWRTLARVKGTGLSILIIDKNLRAIARLADRHHVIEKGRIVWRGDGRQFTDEREAVERLLTV